MLDFEAIEDCFPERGALCAIAGRVTVSAQWLHDFAHKVAEKERKVIRQILEKEINSYCKNAELHAKNNAFNAAAEADAIRVGISWALFVLGEKLGV